MTYSEAEKALGLRKGYFATMKFYHPKFFEQIKAMGDGNILDGYNKFLVLHNEDKTRLQEIYFDLKDRRKISSFGKYLKQVGAIGSKNHIYKIFDRLFFVEDHAIVNMYAMNKKILDLYQDFCSQTMS